MPDVRSTTTLMTIRITSYVITPAVHVEAAEAEAERILLLRYKIGSLSDKAALER